MSIPISQQRQDLQAQIAESSEKIARLEGQLRALEADLSSHLGQRPQYQSLDEVRSSLEILSKNGAYELFRETTGSDPEKQLQQVRGAVAAFQQKTSSLEKLRGVLQTDIQNEQSKLINLRKQLAGLQESVQPSKSTYKPDVPVEISYRITVLPWSSQREDEKRFRYLLIPILFLCILFGGVVPFLKPPVEQSMGIVVPERIARLIKKKQEAQIEAQAPSEKLAENKEEKPEEKKSEEKKEKAAEKKPAKKSGKKPEQAPEKPAGALAEIPTAPVTPVPAPVAPSPPNASQGVLAFKNDLANILNEATPSKMGADAHISINANQATNKALQRSIIVSQTSGSSGGINTATLDRQSSEGDVSKRITDTDIKVARVESAVAARSNNDLLQGKGGKPTRTDEEIQIIFDQYKNTLYRIYNHELRTNPTLRGKMVLRIVIEPDGHVSECTVKSSDLASATLSADIVNRVLKFDFGPKEGAPAITILYPIAFLPSN